MIERGTEFTYDVFISYSHKDGEWVRDWLLPHLEGAGLRVCIDFRDFDVGVPSLVNMERAVDNSRHTLLVLTTAWVASEWAEFEGLLTQTTDPAGRRRCLLPLLLEPCQPPRRIAMFTYADFTPQEKWEAQLQRVVAAVRGELRLPEVGPLLGGLLVSEDVPFLVPFIKNSNFVGRDEDLERLHATLMGEHPVGIRPAGLTGMGGIGKTELAVEYTYRYRDAYPGGVFWINAAELLGQGFASLGRRLQPVVVGRPLDEQIRAAATHLRNHPDSLLVLDNLADPAILNRPVSIDLTPAALPCQVLFTTRRRDLGPFIPVEVTVLPEGPALQLLLRHPDRKPILNPTHPEHTTAKVICRLLGWLPLALEVAGAFLGEWSEVTLADFRVRLRQEGRLATLDEEAGELPPANLREIHDAAVAATLATQWDALADDNARLLLRVAGQLPEAAQIPTARLSLLAGIPDRARPGRPSELARALKRLGNACLVEELHEDRVRPHPLVWEFAACQTSQEETPTFRHSCAANLATAYEDVTILEDHCARRGIDALQEDLITGLTLLPPFPSPDVGRGEGGQGGRGEGLQPRLQSLLRLLQREAHTLRGWNRELRPPFFLQQAHNRAVDMGFSHLANGAATRLTQLRKPYLVMLWRAGPESPELERTLSGHSGSVLAVAVTPDGRRVVSASSDKMLKVWDLQTGQEECTLSGHRARVQAVAVTPDGRWAVSASYDRTLKVWDLQTGREERTLSGHGDWVYAVAVTPDGHRAVSASQDRTLKVWDLRTGQEEHTLSGHTARVLAVAVTPDGQRAISASYDHTLKVWNLQTGWEERTLSGHNARVYAVTVTADGRWAVSASVDSTLKVWDLQTGQEERALRGHSTWVRAVAVTPDGRRAISASDDRTLKVWNLETGREERTFISHSRKINAVAVTPDGHRAVSASDDCTLKVWKLQTGRGKQTLSGHTASVSALAITPDGHRAVSASKDHTLKVWNLQTGRAEHILSNHKYDVLAVAVTPDGRHAVSASSDRTLKVWDLQTGQEKYTLSGHSAPVLAVAVTPDGHRAVSASKDRTLQVWDLQTGRAEHILIGHRIRVRAVAMTPDGRRAVSASQDHILKVWDLQTGHVEHTLSGHGAWAYAVAVTPDGRRAVSASHDRTLKVWDLQTGREERTLRGHSDSVRVVAVTPDGQRAVSGSDDCTLKVWELQTGQEKCTLRGHSRKVRAAVVTPKGRRAVSASDDRTIKVWDLETGQQLATVALDGELYCVAVAPDSVTILAGDGAGDVYCLRYVDPKAIDSGE